MQRAVASNDEDELFVVKVTSTHESPQDSFLYATTLLLKENNVTESSIAVFLGVGGREFNSLPAHHAFKC